MKLFFEKHLCFVVLFLFFASCLSFASGYPVSAYLGIEQGLSNNFVRCVYQDKNGFMWFGTYDGLNRYDGYEFKIFRNNFKNNRSLINNWINAISEDAKGNLWIGTRQGACVYQTLSDNFSFLYYYTPEKKAEQLNSVVRNIEADGQGNMFVATTDKGLLFFPKGQSIAHRIPLENDGNSPYDVTSVKAGNDKKLWLFVSNKGLYVYDYKTNKAKLVNASIRSANCIEAANGYLWIGSVDGLFRYDIASNSFEQAAAALNAQGFNEGKGKPFTCEDIRFATKGDALY